MKTSLTELAPCRTARLSNGLLVIARQVPGMTGCSVSVNYRAGFRDERRDRAGFAHLFEHLMFQGSAKVQPGQHFAEILGTGGVVNGNTYTDTADYQQSAPSWMLDRLLELEADRMSHLALTQENLDIQRRVVLEEISMQVAGRAYGGFPWTVLPEALYADWQTAHDGFGSTRELHEATLQECQEFYDSYYAPANAALGICADEDPDQLIDRAARHFDSLAFRQPPPSRQPSGATAPTTITRPDPLAPRPAFALGWTIPDPSQDLDGYAAMTALSELLTGGSNSLLRQSLRAVNSAVDTSVGLFGPFLTQRPETFVLVAHHDDHGHAATTQLIDSQLRDLAARVPEEHVDAAIARTLARFYRNLDDVAYRTRLMTRSALLFQQPDLEQPYMDAVRDLDSTALSAAAATLVHQTPGRVALTTGKKP